MGDLSNVGKVTKEVIDSIGQVPYLWAPEAIHGVSENIYWHGTQVMQAGSPPRVYCCGFNMEVLIKLLKRFPVASKLSAQDIRGLIPYAFLYTDEAKYMNLALPGRLVELGWADEIEKPADVQYGDIAQIWWDPSADPEAGHSVICTGYDKKDDLPIIHTISAKSKPTPGGILEDWYWHRRGNRTWKIARLKESFLGTERTLEERVADLEAWRERVDVPAKK